MSYDDFQKHLSYLKERGLVIEDEEGSTYIARARKGKEILSKGEIS